MGDVADKPQEGPDDSSKLSPFEQKIATDCGNLAVLKSRGGFGLLKGKLETAADFDEPLEDFKEYME